MSTRPRPQAFPPICVDDLISGYHTAADKVRCLTGFARWVNRGCPADGLTTVVYMWLIGPLNMSAQFDKSGFVHHWARTPDNVVNLLREVGDELAGFPYSPDDADRWGDVRALFADGEPWRLWLDAALVAAQDRADVEAERAERAMAAYLYAKYGAPGVS